MFIIVDDNKAERLVNRVIIKIQEDIGQDRLVYLTQVKRTAHKVSGGFSTSVSARLLLLRWQN